MNVTDRILGRDTATNVHTRTLRLPCLHCHQKNSLVYVDSHVDAGGFEDKRYRCKYCSNYSIYEYKGKRITGGVNPGSVSYTRW